MSYSTDGYGFCVDHINTTAEKVVALASTNRYTLSAIQFLAKGIKCELNELTLEDLDSGMGVAYTLKEVISQELPVVQTEDFAGQNFILFEPTYPWSRSEKNYSREEVDEIYRKYIKLLTDEDINIGYQTVEND